MIVARSCPQVPEPRETPFVFGRTLGATNDRVLLARRG